MTSTNVRSLFVASLILTPAAFATATVFGSAQSEAACSKVLFALTVVVEVIALVQALAVRSSFSRNDHARLTWSLIVAFLVVRLAGELRLATLTFEVVSTYKEGAPVYLFVYVVALRYLYTLGDVLFVAALITTVRAYRSTGLRFELMARDYGYMALLWAMPVITYLFRRNLSLGGIITSDDHVMTYRLVAVFIGAVIASLCVAVRRYAVQMGGGAVARVWNTVVVAGIARDASFLVLAVLLKRWRSGAQFAEQYLLWAFAGCWLLAALYQREVLQRIAPSNVAMRTATQDVS